MSNLIGKHLGKYEIRTEIGRGGMGVVYRGYDDMLKRDVAIKVLPPQLSLDTEFVKRFEQEAVLAASLHHPNIVTIYDVGKQDGVQYIVMQYLEGEPLDRWLRQRPNISLAQVSAIATQMAAALDHAHSRKIIHRDVKPANIMVDANGHATLMDFGLVRAGEGSGLTRTGVIMGTPEYMSPEQALGKEVDYRSDIYSLGVVVYALLCGKAPFERSTPYAISYAHINDSPPPLRQLRPDLPQAVDAVVMKALAKRPEDRYQSAGAFANAFAEALALVAGAPTSPPRSQRADSSPRRFSTPVLVALVSVVMAALALILWSCGGRPDPPPATVVALKTLTPSATETQPVSPGKSPTATGVITVTPTTTPTLALTVTQTPTSLPPGVVMKATFDQEGRFNVRSGPGYHYPIIDVVDTGAVFTVSGRNSDAQWLEAENEAGNTVWVYADLLTTNYPPAAAPVAVNTPKPPTNHVVADSITDFGSEQGDKRWVYLASDSLGALHFGQMPWDNGWYRWTKGGRNEKMRLSAKGSYPSYNSDAARLWLNFYEGMLRIEGQVHKESGDGCGGDGVAVSIVQRRHKSDQEAGFERELWYGTLGPCDTSGFQIQVDQFEVKQRDEIYFITSAKGSDTKDHTIFTARIVLMNEDGVDIPATVTPTPLPTNTPVPQLCFEPRLRHFEEHRGCCGEVAGIAYRTNGRLSWGYLHIEGPPATERYQREFGIAKDGGYQVTALDQFSDYTIWLKGSRIRSKKYIVHYEDKLRAIVDFYQVPCW